MLLILTAAMPADAEVMDKERSAAQNWGWAIGGGLVALAGWRWRWWAGGLLSGLALLDLYLEYEEIHNPMIEPAIRAEAGDAYFSHFYFAALFAIMLHAAATYVGFRRLRAHDALR